MEKNERLNEGSFTNKSGNAGDAIDLSPYFRMLKASRSKAVRFISGTIILFVVALLLFFFLSPKERVTQAKVRFLFQGAEEGKYPNGDRFSAMELVSATILQEIYDVNTLERYLPFSDFKNGFTVLQQNLERDAMEADYKSRLADMKMLSVDRDRLIREFRERLAALRSTDYDLTFIQKYRLSSIPRETLKKIVSQVIATWASNADLKKGALSYRVSVFSSKMVSANLSDNYTIPIIALDILRNQVRKIINNIDQIQDLPGASFIRDAKEEDLLLDIRNRLEEMDRFQINPLLGQVRTQGFTSDPQATIDYLENQLFQLNLQKRSAQDKVKFLESSLTSYLQERSSATPGAPFPAGTTTVIPQIGADFFDKIMELGETASDQDFRKNITERIIASGAELLVIERDTSYYEDFLSLFRKMNSRSRVSPEKMKTFENDYQKVAARLIYAIEEINQIYERIAKHNLNPDTLLYSMVLLPSASTRYSISLILLFLLAFFYWFCVAAFAIAWLWLQVKREESKLQPAA
ncbi:MAG: hypothetical protein KJ808_10095 [Acidobacteria bacterium]|nr:hypothetical protein [Acidobacteriota bacterium]MBU4307758.1 hypothetical protein [Acidobacteriota bacterium]